MPPTHSCAQKISTVSEQLSKEIEGPQQLGAGATMKRVGADAVLIKAQQRDEKGDNKESGRKGFTDQGQGVGTALHMHYKCVTTASEIWLCFFDLYEIHCFT